MVQQHQGTAIDVFNTGPSVFAGGALPQNPYGAVTTGNSASDDPYVGFLPMVLTADQVPSAIATNNIATAQAPATGVALTLTAGTGITLSGGSYYIDGVPGTNPTTDLAKTLSRAVSVTGVASGTGGTLLITGLDLYGNVESQLLTLGAGAVTATTTKAFKAVTSVVPNFTDGTHNITVGTGDVFGLPILSTRFQDVLFYYNSTLISASTGYLAGVTTSPATTTTGDPRGTYAVQSASDGVKRLTMIQAFRGYTNPAMLGVTPV